MAATTERATQELGFETNKGVLEDNNAATSMGEDLREDDFDYSLPIDGYEITMVPDDVILLEEVLPDDQEVDEDGYIIKDGIAYTPDTFKDTQGGGLFGAYRVVMKGKNVEEFVRDDIVVIETKACVPVTFAGSNYKFAREKQIFMKLKKEGK